MKKRKTKSPSDYGQPNLDLSRLKKAWAVQLNKEHAAICWQYGVSLRRPAIEILDLRGCWGSWHSSFRTIRLAITLIRENPWDVVLGVLKHEMAHQVVSDIFGGDDKHGPDFHRACQMLGVPDEYRTPSGDLPRAVIDPKVDDLRDETHRLMDKVQKLLALAQSSNGNEASLAMAKANEIIARYNLDELQGGRNRHYSHLIIDTKVKRLENYQRHIVSILMGYYFVEAVLSETYDAIKDERYRTIELFGATENVLMAEYVFYFLLNHLDILWRCHQLENAAARSRDKRSYWLGVLRGFSDKLSLQEKSRHTAHLVTGARSPSTASALVLAKDQGLREFIRTRYPRLRQYSSRGSAVNVQAFQAGVADGQELTLHRGVTENDGWGGRMITDKGES